MRNIVTFVIENSNQRVLSERLELLHLLIFNAKSFGQYLCNCIALCHPVLSYDNTATIKPSQEHGPFGCGCGQGNDRLP